VNNLDFIFDIVAESKCPDWDRECVIAGAVKAIDLFLDGKDKLYKIEGVELYGTEPAPYKIDIYMTKDGEHKVVDWKYKKKTAKLDDVWHLRESRSWQPKIYAAALATKYGPEVFPLTYEVRGVAADSEDPAKAKVKVVAMKLDREYAVKAVHYLKQVTAERQALIELGKWPWIQNPDGCRCFGPMYKCAFEPVCWEGQKVNLELTKLQELKPLSHSSVKEYIRCPQRYALLQLLGKPEEDDEITAAGTLFHKMMEEVYKTRISEGSGNI
jgi:PD-(D/E)XK nuclease superfamily